jgi:hypothetical protein
MANEAVDAAIGSTNFKQYDNDRNGYVRLLLLLCTDEVGKLTSTYRSMRLWSCMLGGRRRRRWMGGISGVSSGRFQRNGV